MATFPERLRSLREEKNLTQAQLAERLGIAMNTVSIWERGERLPKDEHLYRLSQIIKVPMTYILGSSDDRRWDRLAVSTQGGEQEERIPEGLRRELLDYTQRHDRTQGPIFLTRYGTPVNHSWVSTSIRRLCAAAQVPQEKGNPQCLRRLYQSTCAGIKNNVSLLVEQAYEKLMETEQLYVGWDG